MRWNMKKYYWFVVVLCLNWLLCADERSITSMEFFSSEIHAPRYEHTRLADAYKHCSQVNSTDKKRGSAQLKRLSNAMRQACPVAKRQVATSYYASLIDANMTQFMVHCAQNASLFSYDFEGKESFNQAALLYNQMLERLIGLDFIEDKDCCKNCLVQCANSFAEWSLSEKTGGRYRSFFADGSKHPVTYFCNAIMWQQLINDAGYWHNDCLRSLKEEAAKGKAVLCLAGLDYLYQLLNDGIYTISIVDTGYASGKFNCADEVEWLFSSDNKDAGIGDIIFVNDHCYLKRTGFSVDLSFGLFKLGSLELPRSITQWSVYNKQHQQIGMVVLDRRPVVQQDFEYDEKS